MSRNCAGVQRDAVLGVLPEETTAKQIRKEKRVEKGASRQDGDDDVEIIFGVAKIGVEEALSLRPCIVWVSSRKIFTTLS